LAGGVLLAFGAAAQDGGGGRILDRLAAVVNGRPLTQSQVELEARIALIQRGGAAGADAVLDAQALRPALDYAIAQRLAGEEADKLHTAPVEESEAQAALKTFKGRLGGERPFTQWMAREETDLPQVLAILARGLQADRLYEKKVGLRAQVGEADVRRFWDAHPELHDQSYEAQRQALKDRLDRQRFQQLVGDEIAQARRTADIRLIAPWARGDAEGAP
jgi:hypothetical protein